MTANEVVELYRTLGRMPSCLIMGTQYLTNLIWLKKWSLN